MVSLDSPSMISLLSPRSSTSRASMWSSPGFPPTPASASFTFLQDDIVYPPSIPSHQGKTFTLPNDPTSWDIPLSPDCQEEDDEMYTPDPKRDKSIDRDRRYCTSRGVLNLGFLALLLVGILALFVIYPVISHYV